MKDKELEKVPGNVEIIETFLPTCQVQGKAIKQNSLAEKPPPLTLCKKEGFGNYYVAAREIETGELIFQETTLSVSPYGSAEKSPFCLNCYTDLAYSQKCKICRWPICGEICSAAAQHSSYECQILAKNKVKFRQGNSDMEYLAIETLRCLLLRDKNLLKWEQVLSLEPHMGPRCDQDGALKEMSYVIEFVRDRCHLDEFSESTIVQILGCVSINTFAGFAYTGRHVSLLFAEASFFNHDCTPNTTRRFSEISNPLMPGSLRFSIQVYAARTILPGEVISTNYGDMSAEVVDRGNFLSEHYYFHCDCHRCRVELFNEIDAAVLTVIECDELNNNDIMSTNVKT